MKKTIIILLLFLAASEISAAQYKTNDAPTWTSSESTSRQIIGYLEYDQVYFEINNLEYYFEKYGVTLQSFAILKKRQGRAQYRKHLAYDGCGNDGKKSDYLCHECSGF